MGQKNIDPQKRAELLGLLKNNWQKISAGLNAEQAGAVEKLFLGALERDILTAEMITTFSSLTEASKKVVLTEVSKESDMVEKFRKRMVPQSARQKRSAVFMRKGFGPR